MMIYCQLGSSKQTSEENTFSKHLKMASEKWPPFDSVRDVLRQSDARQLARIQKQQEGNFSSMEIIIINHIYFIYMNFMK